MAEQVGPNCLPWSVVTRSGLPNIAIQLRGELATCYGFLLIVAIGSLCLLFLSKFFKTGIYLNWWLKCIHDVKKIHTFYYYVDVFHGYKKVDASPVNTDDTEEPGSKFCKSFKSETRRIADI